MTEPDATNQTPNSASSESASADAGPEAAVKKGSEPPATAAPASKKPAEEGELVAFAEAEVVPEPLDVAKAETAKYREQLLRTAADFDNFRKRARRDNEDATRRGTEKALKELLPVFDNLERAATSATTAPDVKSVADGLKMIGRQFTNTLEKLGIKRIQAVGTPFDPALHEAIQHVDSTEHPAGVIAVEVQAGYMIGDVLLRAAMVAVSKGAPAEPAEAPASTPTADDRSPAASPEGVSSADEPKSEAEDTEPPAKVEPTTEPKPS